MLAMIKKSFVPLDATTLPLLYETIVRPHLEYGNAIWGPHYKRDQQAVERVLRPATIIIPEISNRSYQERLRTLRLPSLYQRRRRGHMITLFKIFSGRVNIDVNKCFTLRDGNTRGPRWKIFKERASSRVQQMNLSFRAVNDWNSLPSSALDATSLPAFKSRLDKHRGNNIIYELSTP